MTRKSNDFLLTNAGFQNLFYAFITVQHSTARVVLFRTKVFLNK